VRTHSLVPTSLDLRRVLATTPAIAFAAPSL
jgi:hypothetical protein